MKLIARFLTFLLASSVLFSCHSHYRSAAYSYVKPNQISDELPVDAMYNNGMDTGKIVALTKLILDNTYPNVHSMLILRHGKLIYENYFAGEDEIVGKGRAGYVDHTIDDLHDCRSVSKSFTSACIGIAIKQGFIKSIDEPIFSYFPEYAKYFDEGKRKITMRHLLTMTSGLQWDENTPYLDPKNSEIQMDVSDDPVQFILSRKLTSVPGTTWNYSAASATLLGEILRKATGERLDQFARKNLFAPLGIKKYIWEPMLKDKDMTAAAWGLRLRSRDLAKFGLLYMNDGKWGNKQVLDSDWVKQSLKAQVLRPSESPKTVLGYGFQFWTEPLTLPRYKTDLPFAMGRGGQLIIFWRSMDMVLVFTGGNYNRNYTGSDIYIAFTHYIVPSVKEMQPYLK